MGEDNNKDLNYRMGELSGRMSAVENRINGLEDTIKNIDQKLDDIKTNMNKAGGAWKTITIIGSCLVAIASVGGELISKLFS